MKLRLRVGAYPGNRMRLLRSTLQLFLTVFLGVVPVITVAAAEEGNGGWVVKLAADGRHLELGYHGQVWVSRLRVRLTTGTQSLASDHARAKLTVVPSVNARESVFKVEGRPKALSASLYRGFSRIAVSSSWRTRGNLSCTAVTPRFFCPRIIPTLTEPSPRPSSCLTCRKPWGYVSNWPLRAELWQGVWRFETDLSTQS